MADKLAALQKAMEEIETACLQPAPPEVAYYMKHLSDVYKLACKAQGKIPEEQL